MQTPDHPGGRPCRPSRSRPSNLPTIFWLHLSEPTATQRKKACLYATVPDEAATFGRMFSNQPASPPPPSPPTIEPVCSFGFARVTLTLQLGSSRSSSYRYSSSQSSMFVKMQHKNPAPLPTLSGVRLSLCAMCDFALQ